MRAGRGFLGQWRQPVWPYEDGYLSLQLSKPVNVHALECINKNKSARVLLCILPYFDLRSILNTEKRSEQQRTDDCVHWEWTEADGHRIDAELKKKKKKPQTQGNTDKPSVSPPLIKLVRVTPCVLGLSCTCMYLKTACTLLLCVQISHKSKCTAYNILLLAFNT